MTSSDSQAGGLYRLKPAFVRRLHGLEDAAVRARVSPDQLTWGAVGIAAVTAVALIVGIRYPLVWLVVGPLSLARMACNAIDGSLARRTQTASSRGAFLNEMADRAADAITLLALAPAVGGVLALGAVVGALATSFLAVVAQASTGNRLAAGPMGKADRVAVLSLAAGVAAFVGPVGLRAGVLVLIAGSVVTVARRTVLLWRATEAPS